MKTKKMLTMLVVSLFTGILFTGTLAFAICGGSPEDPTAPPGGVATTGTKLVGTLVIDFSKLHCAAPMTPEDCDFNGGPDLAYAKATLKLTVVKGNDKTCDVDNEKKIVKHTFHAFLGKEVPYDEVYTVRVILLEKLTKQIFKKFFGINNPATSGLVLTVKDISPFNIGLVFDPAAAPGTYVFDYNLGVDVDGNPIPIIGFSNAVDISVLVGPPTP